MSGTAPLVAGHAPDSVITWIGARPLTAAQFCGAALVIARALPTARHVMNLCDGAPRFMLWTAAAWVRGQTVVMPPDRLVRSLDRMKRDFSDAYCICDSDDVEAAARDCGLATVRAGDIADDVADHWPPPELPADAVAACLHTSGTTGEPARHVKSWESLVQGACGLAHAFGVPGPDVGVIGTVAPQHMYGFETTIMFPLQCGARLLPVRPSLPADLVGGMRVARTLGVERAWLYTTPLQLRAFHAAQRVDGIERVVTAAMPLDLDLARSVEDAWHAVVGEIYGCTEGGSLAFRRPTSTDVFVAEGGVRFERDRDGRVHAAGGHLPAPVALADRIELVDASNASSAQIRVLGRDDDLVKVAGKRASLAGLTATLRAIPGVDDAAIFFPSGDATRLCAVVVSSMGAAEITRLLSTRIDPAFLPRPLVVAEAIPRSAAQKPSLSALRALVAARAGTRQDVREIAASVRFDADDPVFPGHFPDRAIVPGTLLLERVECELEAHGYRVRTLGSVKFHAVVHPGEALALRIAEASGDTMRFEIALDAKLVASGVCKVSAAAA